MRFHIAINLERDDASIDMRDVRRHTLEMVRIADEAGFEIAWAAEHHALEMTIAPNPFQILTWWAGATDSIRLGSGVVNAAYWHPIDLAGEAALLDLLSDGRLEFGIGSGAYQREFDRMKPGLRQSDSWRYMQEMLPAVLALWEGDYAHDGEHWSFPTATSVPKPLQRPHPPLWAAARSPITFDYAVANGCNVMSWPLTRPFSEAELYKRQLDEAIAKHAGGGDGGAPFDRVAGVSPRHAAGGASSVGREAGADEAGAVEAAETDRAAAHRPVFAMMRHAALYENRSERRAALDAVRGTLGRFENLMRQAGEVRDGFPDPVALESLEGREQYEPAMLEENLMFGSAEQIVEKLKRHEALGVDAFIYYASMNLEHGLQRRSLERFCRDVLPAFA